MSLRQTSIWDSLGKNAPPDQLLSISADDPKANSWQEVPYLFGQTRVQFSFTDFKVGIFKTTTRFFLDTNPWGAACETFVTEPSDKGERMVPYLKSQIQKAVRRKLPHASCQAAWALFKQDPLELLRRLPIIMVSLVFMSVCILKRGNRSRMPEFTRISPWSSGVCFICQTIPNGQSQWPLFAGS
jgi:hypothetical protein